MSFILHDPATVSASLEIRSDARAAGRARRFAVEKLGEWGCAEIEYSAELICSELATNAVVHAKSVYTVTVDLFATLVRVSVVDRSSAEPRRRRYTPMSATGRGLAMVADLATAWGVDLVEGGKRVWFELPLNQPDATTAAIAAAVEATVIGEVDIDALLFDLEGWDDSPGTPRAFHRRQPLRTVAK
jgi:anti-sigma regulatory factor (Ser/Thr protein kinase)